MADITREATIGKLNTVAYQALDSATVFCKLRGNPYVEMVHWIRQILQTPDCDMDMIIRHFGLNLSQLASDVTKSLDCLPRGSTAIIDLSQHVETAVQHAWVYGSLLYNSNKIRTGHLIVAMFKTPTLRNLLLGISSEFDRIKSEALSDELATIVAGSTEEEPATELLSDLPGTQGPSASAPATLGEGEALLRFTIDLTYRAKMGELDPIQGRDDEIRKMIAILMRRRQNNPILVGEAGVGKTAVVEGFAQRIVAGNVPPPLKAVSVHVLDVGLLQAGASMKGEFERRLRCVIEEVQLSKAKPIILFIDEAHTLIGAGGSTGTGDAANLLKPALARGAMRTIAATTWAEYKKYIEKDAALTRRFEVVKVGEPSPEKTIIMLRSLIPVQEKYHQVYIADEALDSAARLSHRYIPDRQLPDKAVSLLDTACAQVSVSQYSVPDEVEDARRRIQALNIEAQILDRETDEGADHRERRKSIDDQLCIEQERLKSLEQRWQKEGELVQEILGMRSKLRSARNHAQDADEEEPTHRSVTGTGARETKKTVTKSSVLTEDQRAQFQSELRKLHEKLAELQGENPLVHPGVDAQAVASVVAGWTGIPVGRMVKNEIDAVLGLADTLEKRVIGQRHALDMIAEGVQVSRSKMANPGRPIGVFMLAGTSGVGKTETALALAEVLYGGERNAITINMSEFQESHTVSKLLGSPPGYVDSDQGGRLTEAVRRRPYSVLLLDEMEKAHPDVHEIFFQIFSRGWIEDSRGLGVDFKNTIILLTTNIGSDLIMNMCKDTALSRPDPAGMAEALRGPLLQTFSAAFLGRLVVVPYYPISDEIMRRIIRLQLDRIRVRVAENYKIPFTYDDTVVELIASRCTESDSGARAIDAILNHAILPRISREFLTRLGESRSIAKVSIGLQDTDFTYSFD